MSSASPLSTLRRAEYTGERRCWPCTVVNVALVGVAVVIASVALTPLGGALVGLVGAVTIWLRGYVVPYTPRFAPRLVEAIPGGTALFDEGGSVPDAPDSLGDDADAPEGDELLGVLVESGVLELDHETVVPTPRFESAWHDEMAALASGTTERLAEAVLEVSNAAEARAVADEERGGEWVALSNGGGVLEETWLTRPVAIAELAAVRALADYLPERATQRAAAEPLRMFLHDCPDCGAELAESTEAACCGGYDGPADVPRETLVCPDCDVRLYTFE
ncbi:hypothetical protein VB773_11400 [Haloarculaceae archaeon H-GB2-1]|nr:hypothetical protein [Haloarculaceae archaeon H-GB1-1]MEA5386581.1 hypothetical protein [Haloarculaceae archaeon H-GB11]MEA5408100.1 hypothetical protein [Haloarculaceae archaeon H-GB2-1]